MKYLSLAVVACLLAQAALTQAALAQELPPDVTDNGFEIEEDSLPTGAGWSRYIGGTLGAVTADGDTVSRQLASLQLDINLPATDRLKTVISVDFADFENSYTQHLGERERRKLPECRHLSRDATPLPDHRGLSGEARDRSLRWENEQCADLIVDGAFLREERETKVADSFVDFSEAYVQWQPADFATVTLGRQNLIWGQFEFLSPVGFLLPYSGSNISPRPSRSDFSYAQDGINLALFPSANSEVQLIHVPQMRVEPSVEENLKAYAARRDCGVAVTGQTLRCYEGQFDELTPVFPDAADYEMTALRFTHYGERLTFSVTALDGAQMLLDPIREAKLVRENCRGQTTTYCYENDQGFMYDDLETLALEFSYIINPRLTIKGELTTYESHDTLNHLRLSEDGGPLRLSEDGGPDLNPQNCKDTDAGRDIAGFRENCLAHIIVTQNNGQPHITNDESFLALGFEYNGDAWFGHFQLVAIDSSPAGEVDELLDAIDQIGKDDDDGDVAPIFFIGRRLGEANDGFIGGGATAFFNAYGAGFFGGWRFNENIEIGGFIGSVIDVTDSGPPSDDHYESLDDGDALAQIGISYAF
jgi:hypothetical protein